ncbi:MAG: hypothetical protein ACT4PJ_12085 [Gemmatimonadaceae bacterium]
MIMRGSGLAFGMFVLSACAGSDAVTEAPGVPPALPNAPRGIAMRGTVDAVAGTLTFEPVVPASPVRLAGVYGDAGVTVRLYNSPVDIVSSGGRKTFSASVGLQNLLPHPIGDEQAGSPLAIMGVYVFVTSGPTVAATSGPCASCAVTVLNEQGSLPFTGVEQPYWYWAEQVGAAGSGNDTTQIRRTWVFEGDAQVTAFQFEVLINAAWPPPHETRWRLHYIGDSVPDGRVEPAWGRTNTSGIATTLDGVLNITTDDNGELEFYRLDSLASTTSAWAEARVQFNSTGGRARAVMHFRDGVKFVALGIQNGDVGFVGSSTGFPFLQSWPTRTNAFRRYQLRKYGTDSAVIYVDDERLGAIDYDELTARPLPDLGTRFQFGSPRVAGTSNADWDYVIFEIGSPQP